MDDLDANRVGDLSDTQRRNLETLSKYRRRNELSIAALLVAVALMVTYFTSSTLSAVRREVFAGSALVVAAFLLVRSITGTDALTRDLQESRVESVEGAIGKRLISGRRSSTYFVDVGNRSFRVGRARYDAAPQAGWVRAYYLPLSRTIVNLEERENASPPPDLTPQGVVEALGAMLLPGNRREANEARASIAHLAETLKTSLDRSPTPPAPEKRDPRPLADAIVGTWSNPILHVTFAADGLATMRIFGREKTARWSVDSEGRLHAQISGPEWSAGQRADQSAEAWIADGRLTIVLDGRAMTFTREG